MKGFLAVLVLGVNLGCVVGLSAAHIAQTGSSVSMSATLEWFSTALVNRIKYNGDIIYKTVEGQFVPVPNFTDEDKKARYSVEVDGTVVTFTINGTTYADGGMYAFESVSGDEDYVQTTFLVIFGSLVADGGAATLAGSDLTAACQYEALDIPDDKIPTLSAHVEGGEALAIDNDDTEEVGGGTLQRKQTYTVPASKQLHGLDFTCRLTGVGEDTSYEESATLNILYPPDITSIEPLQAEYEEGTKLNCTADSNPEASMWSWTNTNDNATEDGVQLILNRDMVGSPQSWKCGATWVHGEETHTAESEAHSFSVVPVGQLPSESDPTVAIAVSVVVVVLVLVVLALGALVWYTKRQKSRTCTIAKKGANTEAKEPEPELEGQVNDVYAEVIKEPKVPADPVEVQPSLVGIAAGVPVLPPYMSASQASLHSTAALPHRSLHASNASLNEPGYANVNDAYQSHPDTSV